MVNDPSDRAVFNVLSNVVKHEDVKARGSLRFWSGRWRPQAQHSRLYLHQTDMTDSTVLT